MPNAAHMSFPSKMHERKPASPKYHFGDVVGAYLVVEYLGHKIPDFNEGFVKMHCYTVECRVCGDRKPMTQAMIDSNIKRGQERARKLRKPVAELGCLKCKGVKPV